MEYINSQIGDLIDEHIHSQRDRDLMKRNLVDGIHYEPLAEEFKLSAVQVGRIVRREKQKLFRYVNDT